MLDPLGRLEPVLPRGHDLGRVLAAPPSRPFADDRMAFVCALGDRLRRLRAFPELVALGFWARAANLKRLQQRLERDDSDGLRRPRGLAFHIAPANVDTIFVYSLLLSLLAGNANIVRISSRGGDQSNALLEQLGAALDAASVAVRDSQLIVRYDHDRAVTAALTALCDLRVIWGGDATVGLIRDIPLKPWASELVFPNKYSLAVIDAAAWRSAAPTEQARLARAFVNDALWFGQAACSSPRALVWRGDQATVAAVSDGFWAAADAAACAAGIPVDGAHAVGKLVAEQGMAMAAPVHIVATPSNRIRVVRRDDLHGLGDPAPAANGFFIEHRIDSLDALAPRVGRHWQTLVSHGVPAADWRDFITTHHPGGIDRIVPFGAALDFDAVWDGTDLLAAMTRITGIGIR